MKYTVLLTRDCNLTCSYCYIGRSREVMSGETAKEIVNFAYANTPPGDQIEIGFFGGEPLLEFDLLTEVVALVEGHPGFDADRVSLTVVTNGTIFSDAIGRYLTAHGMGLGISCDGPPGVHDRHRTFSSGRGSARAVERNVARALRYFPNLMVNAIYRPETLRALPAVVEYFSSLGVRQIYLNPDYTADWEPSHADLLPDVYGAIGRFSCAAAELGDPHFISLIDSKVTAILRGGYQPGERCMAGRGEFAFTPAGDIYPCERLVGDGGDVHRIGNVSRGGVDGAAACGLGDGSVNEECLTCGIREYCMHWCACSNYMASGDYRRVGGFLCASEKAETSAALRVIGELSSRGIHLSDHASGRAATLAASPPGPATGQSVTIRRPAERLRQ